MTYQYEWLYNIAQGDVWGGLIMDLFSPLDKGVPVMSSALNLYEENKYKNKTEFFKDFVEGTEKKSFY